MTSALLQLNQKKLFLFRRTIVLLKRLGSHISRHLFCKLTQLRMREMVQEKLANESPCAGQKLTEPDNLDTRFLANSTTQVRPNASNENGCIAT